MLKAEEALRDITIGTYPHIVDKNKKKQILGHFKSALNTYKEKEKATYGSVLSKVKKMVGINGK